MYCIKRYAWVFPCLSSDIDVLQDALTSAPKSNIWTNSNVDSSRAQNNSVAFYLLRYLYWEQELRLLFFPTANLMPDWKFCDKGYIKKKKKIWS